jgi:hypothetical protein
MFLLVAWLRDDRGDAAAAQSSEQIALEEVSGAKATNRCGPRAHQRQLPAPLPKIWMWCNCGGPDEPHFEPATFYLKIGAF